MEQKRSKEDEKFFAKSLIVTYNVEGMMAKWVVKFHAQYVAALTVASDDRKL